MEHEDIKSASQVVADFIEEQAQKPERDTATISAVSTLRSDGKLTKTNLMRQLEAARKAGSSAGPASGDGKSDD